MYCEPCRVERLGTARFCVICGSKLLQRSREEVEADLARVRWLLAELPEWDATSVGTRPRQYVIERYRQREKILLSALGHSEPQPISQQARHAAPEVAPQAPAEFPRSSRAESRDEGAQSPPPEAPSAVDEVFRAEAEPPRSSREQSRDDSARDERGALAVLLEAAPDVPSAKDRIVTEASSWSRVWKPFLNESIGWFLGAVLILAGTFYLVSDSWSDMNATGRALVVFGLAAGWTLGFTAWARFLSRRETTRGAARILNLIGAAMAPLAPFAVGPVVIEFPFLATPLVTAWCGIAAVLAVEVTRDIQKVGLRSVPISMAACSAVMGLAPLTAGFHGAALWLMVIPVGLLWANARSGAGTQDATARLFAFLAPLYLATIFGVRLHYSLIDDALTWGTWAPFLAIALTAALELRSPVGPDGRPHWERAAEPTSILVVAGQLALMAWAVTGAAPAFSSASSC